MATGAMMNKTAIAIIKAKEEAETGVTYSSRHGAPCPWCGKKSRIYRSLPWEDATRIRYHRCETGTCPLAALRVTIKSVEMDTAP
jgi:hypothetical protein